MDYEMKRILHDIGRFESDILKARNRLIEAIWMAIVGNDTPTSEDGQLLIQNYVQTEDGPGSRYGFIYKGKQEAVLTEIQNIPRNFSYFLHSDRDMMGEVMENVVQLAEKESRWENGGNVDSTGHENTPIHIYS